MAQGKVVKVEVQPYHILDIMADPAYIPWFLRRFHIEMERASVCSYVPRWTILYKDNPKLLYDDAIDEIKRVLGMQESSAALVKFNLHIGVFKIVLNACSDWITEKTGRTPEFERFENTVKSAHINFDYYGRGIAHQQRKAEWQAAHPGQSPYPIDNMGNPGASTVRDELE